MTTQLIKLRGSPTISSHLPAPESCGRTTTKNLHYGNFLLSSPGTTQAASTEHYKHFTILDADAEDRNHKQTHLDKVVRPRKYQNINDFTISHQIPADTLMSKTSQSQIA